MTEVKKRILFSAEASHLNTGFSNYYHELLPRLAATNKYELAEIGSYGTYSDPRWHEFVQNRWKIYGVMPESEQEAAEFNKPDAHPRAKGNNTNQFGASKISYALADFKPDFVVDIRDWWMLEHIDRNPFRSYFKFIAMPTVDSNPQLEEWIQTYERCNLVLSYSDFGIDTLKRSSPAAKVYTKPMRPGVNLVDFHQKDKIESKQEWLGCKDDVKVIGTVMRNQSRKLYPDLIDGFALMKNKYRGERAVDKAVLILHTSWPDNAYSYDYPRHVARLQSNYHGCDPRTYYKGIKNDVFNTFMCYECGHIFVSWVLNLYQRPIEAKYGAKKIFIPCQQCGKPSAATPDTSRGFSREQLCEFYNLLDLYCQVSIAEGDGMPIQEAKACHVPALIMDHSAMAEKGRFPAEYVHLKEVKAEDYAVDKGGMTINIGRHYYEPETSQRRGLPDLDDLADKMRLIITDDELRTRMSREARECVELNYDWDKMAKQWEFVLDSIKPLDRATTWDKPYAIQTIETSVAPDGLNDDQFIDWLYLNILKYEKVDDAGKQNWLAAMHQNGQTREQVFTFFKQVASQQIHQENFRSQMLIATDPNKRESTDQIVGELI